jgi:hypothetical protein
MQGEDEGSGMSLRAWVCGGVEVLTAADLLPFLPSLILLKD